MENSKMKINVGCGWECREGWLNVDNTTKAQSVNYPIIKMDATIVWPYADQTFDHVLSEHMIEHVPEEKGLFMLKEAYRTLKFNGVARITCPNRTFAESLPGKDEHSFVDAYARKIFQRPPRKGDANIISNRTLNEQGHLWVPTPEQLILQLIKAGFSDVKQVEYGKSEHADFNGIELNDGVRNWESVCVEGIKK